MLELLLNEPKVLLIDWGLYLHRAVFAWSVSDRQIPATYTCLRMMLSSLKTVGIQPDDTVIVAIDGRGNWRRDVDPQYKANRKELRDKNDIDWKYWYNKFDEMIERLKTSTPFTYIRIDKLEADDIIAVAVRKFKPRECIIISSDSDFEQLCVMSHVKIFSPVSKKYKIVANGYKVLADKVKKEKTDNLISPILNEADYKRRHMIVSLLESPKFVEEAVLDKLNQMEYNDYDLRNLPFKSLQSKFMDMYNNDEIETFEKSVKSKIKKKKSTKKSRKEIPTNELQNSPKIF